MPYNYLRISPVQTARFGFSEKLRNGARVIDFGLAPISM